MPLGSPPSTSPLDRRGWLAGLLVLVGVVAYLPMLRNGFVWDDDTFLTKNVLIKAPDGLWRFWFSTQPSDYWPVTSTTLWVEWRLWGMHAVGYHVTNLILHVAEGLMLWSVLRRLKVPGAYLAALLFVVHPVNVESVAWIAQRKNLMAMLFYLASSLCFLKTDLASPTATPGSRKWYWLSLLTFILALLSKGSVAPLPVVFLGIIAWRRRVTLRDVLSLAPFFLVAVVLIGVNIWFQTHGSGEVVRQANGLERLLGAGAVVWFYLSKALLPVDLTFVYPQWHISAANLFWWLPLLGAIAVTGILWWKGCSPSSLPVIPSGARNPPLAPDEIPRSARNDKGWRSVLFAWLYFGVMLLPVMGFTDVYFMRYSLVADHYQHIAIIGVLALAAAGWAQWGGDARWKLGLAAAVVAGLAVLTWQQCGMYRDTPTLYRVTLERNPDCWMVYNNLALSEAEAGQTADATRDFERALQLNPDFYEAHLNFGSVLLNTGHPAEALVQYEQAARSPGNQPVAHYSLGNALHSLGRNPEAIREYERAVQLRPDYPDAENNLGFALETAGRLPDAVRHYRRALQLDPDNVGANYNLGNALRASGQGSEAIGYFEKTVRLSPGNFQAHNNLGIALAEASRFPEAAHEFQEALRVNPGYAPAQQNLARLQAMLPSSP
jgi:protein O-mannosyl-transferase